MRKTTRNIVLLLVVAVIYFGYSGWIDGAAIYNIDGVQWGSAAWVNKLDSIFNNNKDWVNWSPADLKLALENLGSVNGNVYKLVGFMAPNSLMKVLLDPFKLVLVGGVFAMLIPLTKEIFFSQIIGLKNYLKTRRSNVLFNYQSAIAWATDMNSKLSLGDYEQVKAHYAAYGGLAFKPQFMTQMVEEIGDALIRELDLSIFVEPSKIVITSLKEMYEKERALAVAGRADEMFFDFKRGYEFSSAGSKYSIAYYKALSSGNDSESKLGWKIFSLEMLRFHIFLIAALVPTIIISGIILPLVGTLASGKALEFVSPLLIFITWFVIAIILHATFTLTKTAYRNMKSELTKPAAIYYGLLMLIAISLAAGFVGISRVGDISEPGTAGTHIWLFFSALGYLVLSTCLALYVLATIMDANKSPEGMTRKLFIDGIVLPLIAWIIATAANFTGIFLEGEAVISNYLAGLNSITLIGFWVYLSCSSILMNNIVLPSARKQLALQAELAQQGKEAQTKKEEASK